MDLAIDVRAKRPSYLQLADRLRSAIEGGELAANDQLPSLHQLAAETGLAVSTIQKTIRTLERSSPRGTPGLLSRRGRRLDGRGQLVKRPP